MQFAIIFSAVFVSVLANYDGYKFEVQHVYHPQVHNEVVHHGHQYYHQEKAQEAVENHKEDEHHHVEHYVDYVGHPKYHYDYAVHDPHTHDVKNQWEVRDGKHVKGEYSVVQPDGKTRVVKYESDGKHGINYDVKYIHGYHH